jgi:zeta-carotene desaturase
VLAEMFGADPRAAAIALPTKPLHLMYAEPARHFVENAGGTVRTGSPARIQVQDDAVTGVESAGEQWSTDRVIAAVPWFALADLFSGEPGALTDVLHRARRMSSSPIVTVNLWFDRRVMEEPFIGLPGRAMQWVFDKRLVLGGDASHVSLVSSGASSMVGLGNDALIANAHADLLETMPELRVARLVSAAVVREPRATFSLAPGQPLRPSTRTAVHGLMLAGDWIDTGLPATIESAVRSGHQAAEQIPQLLDS